MKKNWLCLLSVGLLFFACGTEQAQNTIVVDLSEKGADVAPSMYGIFFEEINHAGDGGLYAELIQNRGFEEHVIPSGMSECGHRVCAPASPSYYSQRINDWQTGWDSEGKKFHAWSVLYDQCTVTKDVVTPVQPLHKNTPHAFYLQIDKMQQGGKAALINSGYWGIVVRENEKYDLRFFLNTRDYSGNVTAKIYDNDSKKEVATHTFAVVKSGRWEEYKAELTVEKTISEGDFRLEFSANGTILVDYVSLFPQETFRNRPNGLRKDLVEALAAMKPAFMRWPGGCIVEGATLENRVKWKETLGDPVTRRGEWVLWGYRSTFGLGYHEFLQFCEDMNMDAMFVGNVGLSCSIRNGDYVDKTELEPFVQDIRDAIEYATGDITTEWGKRRALNGHPEPFPLKYVELGNENHTRIYADYFNHFYFVLKEEYPEIIFINTMSWKEKEMELVEKTDMVDPHWYENPGFFFSSNELFDKVERGKYLAYVGEYACNNGVRKGNMEAALSEAAFIMGMERNSDLVTMTSYAPLLSNDNQPNWKCNLIWFNNEQVVGRASYYVQSMFAHHRPDYNLKISKSAGENQIQPIPAGTFGLGAGDKDIEYKEIRLTTQGKTRSIVPADFTLLKGEWNINNDESLQTDSRGLSQALLKDFSADEYILECKVRKDKENKNLFIYYGMSADGNSGFVYNIGFWGGAHIGVERIMDGHPSGLVGTTTMKSLKENEWYDLKFEVSPEKVTLFINDELVLDWHAESYPLQFFQAGYDQANREVILKIVNAGKTVYKGSFELNGVEKIEKKGKVIVLKADNLYEENSFEEPQKIYPQESSYHKFGKKFDYEFPPYSLTILRIKGNKSADGVFIR